MKNLATYIITMLMGVLVSNASTLDEVFEKANQYYAEENYKAAAQWYDSIAQSGVVTQEVYYNLGNCYYKLGKTAPSILNYERALRIDPGDEDTRHNLNLANLRVITKLESTPPLFYEEWWNNLITMFGSGVWARYGILFIWVALLIGVLFIFSRSLFLKRICFFAGLGALVFSMVLLFLAFMRYQTETDTKNAIITAPNVYIKSAPDKNSTDLFILHEGVKARITDKVGDWQQVRLADGKVGWIRAAALEVI